MSLSFTVSAGPLSQVGLEIVSLNTAVQLAVGAYGWFKARARSESLADLLSISGCHLVATSAFDVGVYRDIRSHQGTVQGVVIQNGAAHKTSLPNASTAVPEDSGWACLRALTTGLLCLYDNDLTITILRKIVPLALVQMDRDNTTLSIEGPLLFGLKHWVAAVAVEEDSSTFRDYILARVVEEQSRLIGIPEDQTASLNFGRGGELSYVVGFLNWMLTPEWKRSSKQYPTRSLCVWSVASIMCKLGFSVFAAPKLVKDASGYEKINAHGLGNSPDVHLVIRTGLSTDNMVDGRVDIDDDTIRPRQTVLSGIPWVAFSHLRGYDNHYDIRLLVRVWNNAFRNARNSFVELEIGPANQVNRTNRSGSFSENAHIHIKIRSLSYSSHHVRLIERFMGPSVDDDGFTRKGVCGDFVSLISRLVKSYISESSERSFWASSAFYEKVIQDSSEEETESPENEEELRMANDYFKFKALLLGTIYGLCSSTVFDNGHSVDDSSELAFISDILSRPGLSVFKSWISTVNAALMEPGISYRAWIALLFEMFTGLTAQKTFSKGSEGLLLGAQANGLAMVSSFIIDPSGHIDRGAYFHLSRGQIVSLPVSEQGYIQASTVSEKNAIGSSLSNLKVDEDLDQALRLDVEPSWNVDPRTVAYVPRLMGIPLGTISIETALNVLVATSLQCEMPEYHRSKTRPICPPQNILSLKTVIGSDLEERSINGVLASRETYSLDASASRTATIIALGMLSPLVQVSSFHCVYCASNTDIGLDVGQLIVEVWNVKGIRIYCRFVRR